MNPNRFLFPAITVALCAVGACASSPPPIANVASAEAAVRAAGESGARERPNAALHLHYAELQRDEGHRLMRDGENERAAMQFRRAEADANLAVALAHESGAQRTASNAVEAVQDNQPGTEKIQLRPTSTTLRSN